MNLVETVGMPAGSGRGAPGTDVAVSARGLTKRYGGVAAVDGVDLEIRRGEVFALLGPNGAGKTTTVEVLEGLRRRSGGEVSVLGVDPFGAGAQWRAAVGIVPQSTGAFDELTVRELVRHFRGFYPRPLPVGEVLDLVGLAEQAKKRSMDLSGGQKRRLDIALGIVGSPEVVFLDEPTTGLDPVARRHTWDLVRGLTDRGATVLLTTHYLDEAEALADRAAIIIGGRVEAVGTPRELGGRSSYTATVTFALTPRLAAEPLPLLTADAAVETDPASGTVRVRTTSPSAAVVALAQWSARLGVPELPSLAVSRPSLEDVYLRMISARESRTGGAQEESA